MDRCAAPGGLARADHKSETWRLCADDVARVYLHTRASVSADRPNAALISPTIAYDCANTPVWMKTWQAMAMQIAASNRQAQPTMIDR